MFNVHITLDFNNVRRSFTSPTTVVQCSDLHQIENALFTVQEYQRKGYWAVGFISYEAGWAFVDRSSRKKIASRSKTCFPLLWFGIFKTTETVKAGQNDSFSSVCIKERPYSVTKNNYIRAVGKIKERIKRGYVYQVNYTLKKKFISSGSPQALYAYMRKRQTTRYGVCIEFDDKAVISSSPELFFEKKGRTIVTRPMKGTAPCGLYEREDAHIARALAADEKNRAENVMIVDLMRNDLGRICVHGSIKATSLFEIERHSTLFQMTSTVKGQLRKDVQVADIIKSLFPSGSITGAPKRSAMGIIKRLETNARGVYTGAVGYLAPRGDTVFSIAIRTVQAVKRGKHKEYQCEAGIGSGVTWGSDPCSEYDETRLKGRFLERGQRAFEIIETMLCENGAVFLFELHCERLRRTADHFGFMVDMKSFRQQVACVLCALDKSERYRLRALLAEDGTVRIAPSVFIPGEHSGRVLISRKSTDSSSLALQFKTTLRGEYDREYRRAAGCGFDDVLFFNERGELTEGAISNVLLEFNGRCYTPPRRCGLLAGTYRESLLRQRQVTEKVLYRDDLFAADVIYLCNAVRKQWVVKAYSA